MAAGLSSAASNHPFTTTIGSGVAATFNYLCPNTTTYLCVAECSNSAAPAAPTAMSYNGTALTLVPGSFISNSLGLQTSLWYLASPTIGTFTLSVTYGQSVTGGAGLIMIPLLGIGATPLGTASTAFSNTAVASAFISPAQATTQDIYISSACVQDLPTTATSSAGAQLANFTSRSSILCLASDRNGSTNGVGWTFSPSSGYAMTAVAFLGVPSNFVPFPPWRNYMNRLAQ